MSVREYVAGFAFCDGRVALVLKNRPAWQAGKWNGIGGHIEAGELPNEAMAREFHEEADYFVPPALWEHFATLEDSRASDGHAWRVYWFRTDIHPPHTDRIHTASDEEIAWHPIAALPQTIPNLHWLVPLAGDRQRHDWPLHVLEHAATPHRDTAVSVQETL